MSNPFQLLDEGKVHTCDPKSDYRVAYGSRVARLDSGELVCSFMSGSALAMNSVAPFLSRSKDNGKTWSPATLVWPHLTETMSLFPNISRAPDGRLFLYGISIPIEPGKKGQTYWSDATQGISQTDIIWAVSGDGGKSWTESKKMPRLLPGSHEAPGALCVTRKNVWVAPYSPYNTWDPNEKVERGHVVAMRSENEGKTWTASSMIKFAEPHSGGAEAWVIELTDGRLLGTTWHIDHKANGSHTNKYALSSDGGKTWSKANTTTTNGNTTVLEPYSDGRALFGWVKRKKEESGIGVAVVKPTEADFGIQSQQMVYVAKKATQSGKDNTANEFQDFSFGEPSLTVLPNKELLMTFWAIEGNWSGIHWKKYRMG
ncbi:MAG: exo-alpha-sialidase [SAR202 cluster bacterium]|nr:exo-alpha-sialidase [SAR202 cluster bacterium]